MTKQLTREEIKSGALLAQKNEQDAFRSILLYTSGSCKSAMLRKAEKFADEADRLWSAYHSFTHTEE